MDRLRAADALKALRLYPFTCDFWLDGNERHDAQVEEAGEDDGGDCKEKEEDDYADILPPPSPDDPKCLWNQAKAQYPDKL